MTIKIKEMIIDYSRRTDPACIEGVRLLERKLKNVGFPRVLHFWTKSPFVLAALYKDIILELQSSGVLVVAQVTLNFYDRPLESVTEKMRDISVLMKLLGSECVHLRFDPIIFGYTTLAQYRKTLKIAEKYNIEKITVNFLEPKYEGVGRLLRKFKVPVEEGTLERKIETLQKIRKITPEEIDIAVCAESSELSNYVEGIKSASCTDPEWFKDLSVDLVKIKGHKSRKGCGCFYTDDWGQYPGRNGYVCKHGCLYCYAKHNIFSKTGSKSRQY